MSDAITRLRTAATERVVTGSGTTSPERRRAAFDNKNVDDPARALVDKVANTAWKVTDEDVAAAKAAGLSEDEIFELTIAAAFGQSTRQLTRALTAVEAAFSEIKP
jgi:alkylhydroperoxidase family enzyme